MTALDWGLGKFELIAPRLLPAAHAAVEVAALREGEHVVDVGCGSGNAALLAARPNVLVTGVDPAPRLLEVARARAAERGLDVDFVTGDAASVPLADATADVVMSVFGVIFAPDPVRAAAELARITTPTGRVVLTAWLPGGFLQAVSKVLTDATAQATGFQGPPPFAWHERDTVAALLGPHGFAVDVHERDLAFTAESVDDYWQTQLLDHPMGVAQAPLLEQHGLLAPTGDQVKKVLSEYNEDPEAFGATARYVVLSATRK